MKNTRPALGFSLSTAPLFAAALLLAAALVLPGCGSAPPQRGEGTETLHIKGSDTMLRLVNRWAEDFMKLHPEIAVYTEGGGSETGIRALIEGDADLSSASRTLRPSEVKQLLQKRGSLGLSILAAKDALSVYLNPSNPVRDLSLSQLKDIFSGHIENWKEISGEDLPIVVIGRPPNSGTFLFFEEHVLEGEPYGSRSSTVPTTSAVIAQVKAHRGAIGYGGLAYGKDVIHCAVEGVEPTAENVRNGSYPIARYLYFFAAAPPRGSIKLFVDWVLSNAGQQIVEEIGYIPLWELPQ
jgi:phosphate transport system substrate-binding protein